MTDSAPQLEGPERLGVRASRAVFALLPALAAGIWVRTRNLAGLRDAGTGEWSLAPVSDPYLFVRWAEQIAQGGGLDSFDSLRYYPFGYFTGWETTFHAYLLAGFHRVAAVFGSGSVMQSAAIYPVCSFAVAIVLFFFLARRILRRWHGEGDATFGAGAAALLLAVVPVFLERTLAGVPEKEASALPFLFAALWLFVEAWERRHAVRYVLAGGAGLATAAMGLVWGGVSLLFLIVAVAALAHAVVRDRIEPQRALVFAVWLVGASIAMNALSARYSMATLVADLDRSLAFAVLGVFGLHLVLWQSRATRLLERLPARIPRMVWTGIAAALLTQIGAAVAGAALWPWQTLAALGHRLAKPYAGTALNRTIEENLVPMVRPHWAGLFGPEALGVPLLLLLLLLGTAAYTHELVTRHGLGTRLARWGTTAGVLVAFVALLTSRLGEGPFDGSGAVSLAVEAIGWIALLAAAVVLYRSITTEGRARLPFEPLLVLVFLVLTFAGARGWLRLMPFLAPPTALVAGHLLLVCGGQLSRWLRSHAPSGEASTVTETESEKLAPLRVRLSSLLVLLLASLTLTLSFGRASALAGSHVPDASMRKWQEALAWIERRTPPDAVIAQWWDYGYWTQALGERATLLDGGNFFGDWNRRIARDLLTATRPEEALRTAGAHGATHLLLDTGDLRSYPAISAIASEGGGDRLADLPALLEVRTGYREATGEDIRVYAGGHPIHWDIQLSSTRRLPAHETSLEAIWVYSDPETGRASRPPTAVLHHAGRRFEAPIRHLYGALAGRFEEGLDAGAYVLPAVARAGESIEVAPHGALLFVPPAARRALLVRLLLFGETAAGFSPLLRVDHPLVHGLREAGRISVPFIYEGGRLRGPLGVWEIREPPGLIEGGADRP